MSQSTTIKNSLKKCVFVFVNLALKVQCQCFFGDFSH